MHHCGSRVGRPFRVSAFAEAPANRSSRTRQCALRHTVAVLLLGAALTAGCGKKGPPLPPLVRIPEAVAVVATRRTGNDAYVTIRVPARNVDGSTPVDVSAVEVVALTAERPPSRAVFLERGRTVATIAVASTSPSTPSPTAAASPGAPPGGEVTVLEMLTDDMFVPAALPATPPTPPTPVAPATPPGVAAPASSSEPGRPAAAEAAAQASAATPPPIRRYYMAFTRDARKRPGPSATIASVSLAVLPEAPGNLRVTYTEQTLTVTWNTVAGAAGYNVYTDAQTPSEPPASDRVTPTPRPLNPAPIDNPTYSEPVRFGELACYRVTAVRGTVAELSEGLPSAAACERPRDTFAPAAPGEPRVVPGGGEITVEWVANVESDLAGYLVLRGTAGDDTLQPITAAPIREMRFVDRSVTPGVRYAYAVVAVDSASNRSAASDRGEATAR
jgi:hypothetical protein